MDLSVFIRLKYTFVSFSNAKYVDTGFVKIKEYTHRKKKNNRLENDAYFPFRHYSREQNIMRQLFL